MDALESKEQFVKKLRLHQRWCLAYKFSSQIVQWHEMSQEADRASEFVNLWGKEYQITKKEIGASREERKPHTLFGEC